MERREWKKQEILELRAKLDEMTPVDIAEYLMSLTAEERGIATTLLDKETLAEVFAEYSPEAKQEYIADLSQPEITELLFELDSDELVDAIQELPANMVTKILTYVDSERRHVINQLLKFPKESVGSLMSVDFVVINEHETRQQVINKIKVTEAGYEHLTAVYVLGSKRELIGYIYVADLIRSEDEDLSDITNHDVLSVQTLMDQEEASVIFNKYHILALPVTDSENRLVGIITADDILDVIVDEIHEDYTLMQGIQTNNENYLESSPWELAKQRVFWLLFLMVSATFTGKIIQAYDHLLSTSVILAAYIPMLMDSGGNSGSQASTMVIRAMALDEIQSDNFLTVIWKEMRVGMIVGMIVGVINFSRIMIFDYVDYRIALTVSLALLFTVILSKVVGGVLPIIAKVMNQDPAVMASPLVTTIVDALALILYFSIATQFMHLI